MLWALWLAWRPGRLKALGLAGLLLVLGALPVGDILLSPLETRYPSPELSQVDGIIVLGGGENGLLSHHWGQVVLGSGAERLTATVALARRFPEARIIVTGGNGSLMTQGRVSGDVAGARYMLQLLQDSGIDPSRVQVEGQSRNTVENVRLSRPLAAPRPGQVWVVVTSAFHMPRTMGIFAQQEWDVVAYPVDYRSGAWTLRVGWNLGSNLEHLNTGAREWVGLMSYWATGRAVWPF